VIEIATAAAEYGEIRRIEEQREFRGSYGDKQKLTNGKKKKWTSLLHAACVHIAHVRFLISHGLQTRCKNYDTCG
jgi:hypothetical protein